MNIFTLFFSFVLTYSFAICSGQKNQTGNNVTAAELKEWVSYLASDQMRGRKNGSPEMKTAALWIAGKFSEYGVKNLGEKDSFFQDYSFTSRQKTIAERNVIGIIEGSDPALRDQYIVISAHFDHIGIRKGNIQDSICNGADDNASGTCALIGIAKYIKLSGLKPGRSIILAAFSGEESGMRGSRYFISSPMVPLKNIVADINFEMIGHSELLGKKNYYMTGCLNSNLDDLIKEYNRDTDFSLVDTMGIANQLFSQSDNISFSRISMADGKIIGIPSGTFATATMADYLHSFNDEAGLFDFGNMADLVNYFSNMIVWLSNTSSEIKWTDQRFSRP
jgi:hypothetical protein